MKASMDTRPRPRWLFLAAGLVATAWPGMAVISVAKDLDLRTPRQRTDTPKPRHVARPRPSASCAEFGPGFVRMPGSDSCIRFGGGVGLGVGAVP